MNAPSYPDDYTDPLYRGDASVSALITSKYGYTIFATGMSSNGATLNRGQAYNYQGVLKVPETK